MNEEICKIISENQQAIKKYKEIYGQILDCSEPEIEIKIKIKQWAVGVRYPHKIKIKHTTKINTNEALDILSECINKKEKQNDNFIEAEIKKRIDKQNDNHIPHVD